MDIQNSKQHTMLQDVYKTCTMGTHAIEVLLPYIADKKFKDLVNKQNDIYEAYCTRCEEIAKSMGMEIKGIGAMIKFNSMMSIKASMLMDNSKTNIATKLVQGTTMGITTVIKNIHKYPNIHQDIRTVSEEILKDMEAFVESLKEYI